MKTTYTPEDVAKWMLEQIKNDGFLFQETAVYAISSKFGEDFTYINNNGNPAIRKDVLASFRKSSGDDIVWQRGEKQWRQRQSYDSPGRNQID
ncbi:MAG: DUF6953 family protein [Acidithiobacillus sp.]